MNFIRIIKSAILKCIKEGHWYNDVEFKDCKKFWNYNTFNTDVMVIGSASGVHSFNFDNLPVKGVNFAMTANPQCADLAILKCYYSYLKPSHSTVIISLCPFTSLSGNYEYLSDKYYTILTPPAMPVFYFWKKQEVYKKMRNPLPYYPLVSLFTDIKYAFSSKKERVLSEHEMENNAQQWISSWMKEFSWQSFEAPLSVVHKDGIQEAVRLLNETISFSKERGIRPIMVIPPMYHTLAEKFTPKARHILIDSIVNSIKDKSVSFLNYMDDMEFAYDNTVFLNSYLLNKIGAKRFTKRVLSDIKLL